MAKEPIILSRLRVALAFICALIIANVGAIASYKLNHFFGFVPMCVFLALPGYLMLRTLGFDRLENWAKLGISLSFSLALLIFDGLIINTVLPILGDDKPLSLLPILLSLDAIVLFLLALVYRQRPTVKFRSPVLRDYILMLGCVVLPVLAAAGATRINNGGSDILSVIVILAVTVSAFVITKKFSRLKRYVPLFLYIFSATLLLLWSLRSYHLSGGDIGDEHYAFGLTLENSRWSINAYQNAYNACLSITILPTMFARLSSYGSEAIFKLWYPLMFAITTPVAYIYFKRIISSKKAFLAAFFICTQSIFILWMPMLARQEIALIFFTAIMLLLFGDLPVDRTKKEVSIYILSIALIFSHYSSAYVTFVVLAIGMILQRVIRRISKNPKTIEDSAKFPSIIFMIFFVLITFLWQIQLTATGKNLSNVLTDTIQSLTYSNGGADKNVSAGRLFSLDPFSSGNTSQVLQTYSQQLGSLHIHNSYPDSANYNDEVPVTSYKIPSKNKIISWLTDLVNAMDSIILRASVIIGLIVMIISSRKRHYTSIVAYSIGFLVLLVLLGLLPFISTAYNVERLYQHALLILAIPVNIGLFYIVKPFTKIIASSMAVLILMIIFFWYNTGLTAQYVGGAPSGILNNKGSYYDQNYTTTAEVDAIQWLSKNRKPHIAVYADKASDRVMASYGNVIDIDQDLFPEAISQSSYVYLNRASTLDNEMTVDIDSNILILTPPKQFLNQNKDKIYANNQTEIFK